MPKVNTFNYDTIASWNGSQDLFVVEQPDGTKVATPAMVKQFIEAGDFEATGEVKDGHGNILADMANDIDEIISAINDLEYSRSGLTTNAAGTIVAGGYFRIGKLVVVNLRIQLNATGAVVYGLPKPAITDTYNAIGGVAYNSDRETVGFYYLGTGNGNLSISGSSGASGTLLISFVYAAQ